MLSWWTKNQLYLINSGDIVTNVLLLCSVYQAPSYGSNLTLLSWFLPDVPNLSMLFSRIKSKHKLTNFVGNGASNVRLDLLDGAWYTESDFFVHQDNIWQNPESSWLTHRVTRLVSILWVIWIESRVQLTHRHSQYTWTQVCGSLARLWSQYECYVSMRAVPG